MSGFTGDSFPSILGGGIPGAQPKGGLLGGGSNGYGGGSGMEGGGQRATDRLVLRSVFGNTRFPNNPKLVITPFRRYFNAGDTAGSVNSYPSTSLGRPTNQVKGSSIVSRIQAQSNGVRNGGQALYTGNVRYVYDSSVYVKYKRLVAENRTYNDLSFGGDNASAAQSALRRVRRGFA